MQYIDDDLNNFAENGGPPLPIDMAAGTIENDGATIWYTTYGAGLPVILLHGGLGHSGNWSNQVLPLVDAGHQVILIDSRGHGHSTRDARPYSYDLLATDVLAIMDALQIEHVRIIGWSDGACTAMILASMVPSRVAGIFFFACNMDPSGTKEIIEYPPILIRCFNRHAQDYKRLSSTPEQFDQFVEAVSLMQRTQPNWSAADLARMQVPISIVHSENDEFIKREHAEYLARSIPNAEFIYLPGVSHFAPIQRPDQFNKAVLDFLVKTK